MCRVSSLIGIDIGGTKIASALYDERGWKLLKEERCPTGRERGYQAVLEDVFAAIERLRRTDTRAIGIGVPGLVRHPEGVIIRLPNIPGAENAPLRSMIEERTGLPVTVGNDSNGFALAEAIDGAGKGERVVAGVTMGTGVGGGIVMNGKLFTGADGFAAEFGHTILVPGEPPYETDDRRGEAEQFLSGTALRKRCPEAKKPEDVFEGKTCAYLHPEIIRDTAILCANIIHMINPSVIVFGGGTGRALRRFLPDIETEITRWIMKGTPLPRLAIRKLEDAATRGAAMLIAHA